MTIPEFLQSKETFYKLGKTLGSIHRLSKNLKLTSGDRKHWYDNQYLLEIDQHIPKEFTKIHQAQKQLTTHISTFKKNEDNYGLIHGDIHPANFLLADKQLTLIDFDESQYSFLVEDIAVTLYYTLYVLTNKQKAAREELAKEFMFHFMEGYLNKNPLPFEELKKIDDFMKLREIISFVGAFKKWDFSNLTRWQKEYLNESQERIIRGEPIVSFDRNWL